MKSLKSIMRIAVVLTALVPAAALAQKISLDVDTKDLAAKAVETVEVTLDGPILKAAARFLAADPDGDRIVNVVRRLGGIYVRSYTFAKEGEYDRALIQQFRSKIGPSWQKIVNVQSLDSENVEIYTQLDGEVIAGMVIVAAEPKELTFINIVGPMDLADLASLEGQLGIPKMSAKTSKEK